MSQFVSAKLAGEKLPTFLQKAGEPDDIPIEKGKHADWRKG